VHLVGEINWVLWHKNAEVYSFTKKRESFTLIQAMKTQRGVDVQLPSFFNLITLPLGKRAGTHCIGGWVGHRAGLYGGRKVSHPPGSDTRTILTAASRHFSPRVTALNPFVINNN
jgi:hypothetical protein